jgi:hypothetical protein
MGNVKLLTCTENWGPKQLTSVNQYVFLVSLNLQKQLVLIIPCEMLKRAEQSMLL